MKKLTISIAVVLALASGIFLNKSSHKHNLPTKTVTVVQSLPPPKVVAPSPDKPVPDAPLAKIVLPKKYDAILLGEINSDITSKFVKDIQAASDQKQVTVRITSPGGDAYTMLFMIQNIEDLKKQKKFKLVCVADILTASAAFLTFETSCDTRLMTYRTILLAHGVQGRIGGTNIATAADDLHEAELLQRMTSVAAAKRMGMTTDAYLEWILGRNRWLGPEEALQHHAVDGVINPLDAPAGQVDSSDDL